MNVIRSQNPNLEILWYAVDRLGELMLPHTSIEISHV
jgi:hypothetical protein